MAIETLYDRMGGMGRFQVMTSILIALCQVPVGWSMLQMTFDGVIPDFQCLIRDAMASLDSHEDIKADVSNNRMMNKYHSNQTLNKCSVNGTSCDSYFYDTSAENIIMEWGLVCDMKWVKKIIISIQMSGVLLGAFLAGQCSDLFGRKRVMYEFVFVHMILNFIAAFSSSWIMFTCLRFFIGICIGSVVVVVVPFQMEFLPVDWRSLVGIIPSFNLGLTIFSGAAALLENWTHLHLVCAGFSLLAFLCGWFVPESPRWLAVKGKLTEAENVIKRIAKMNRETFPEETLSVLQSMRLSEENSSVKIRTPTYIDLFKTKFTAKISLLFFYYWFVLAVVYYGISFGVGSFVGNLYLNIFLLGVLEMPMQTTTFYLNNKIGRRITTLLFLGLCLLSLLGCLLFNELSEGSTSDISINVLSLTAKMMIGSAWSAIHIWGTELFPTVVRNLGCGFACLGARVGGILAPFIIDFDEMMSQSYAILCVLLIVAIFVAFGIPETKGKVLNDHIKNRMNSLSNSNVDDECHKDSKEGKMVEVSENADSVNDCEKCSFLKKFNNRMV